MRPTLTTYSRGVPLYCVRLSECGKTMIPSFPECRAYGGIFTTSTEPLKWKGAERRNLSGPEVGHGLVVLQIQSLIPFLDFGCLSNTAHTALRLTSATKVL